MAESAEVRVYRGQSVTIPLKAGGRIPGPLRYVLRSQPTQGALEEIKVSGKNAAAVIYHHKATSEGTTDSFRFAVQATDSPVSAPATITIQIEEEPAKLAAASSMDFGGVPIAGEAVRQIVVTNTGGTGAQVVPDVEGPWTLKDKSPRTIPPRGRQSWQLTFSPPSAGAFEGSFTIREPRMTPVRLLGRGIEVLKVLTPEPFILKASAGRRLEISFQNPGKESLTFAVGVPEGIQTPGTFSIPAGATTGLLLAVDPAHTGEIKGHLEVAGSGGFKKRLAIAAEPMPADLIARPAGDLRLTMDSRSRLSGKIELSNQGGQAARLETKIPDGLVVIPDPAQTIIPAGESKTFEVILETNERPASGRMVVEFLPSGGKPLTIAVLPPQISLPSMRGQTSRSPLIISAPVPPPQEAGASDEMLPPALRAAPQTPDETPLRVVSQQTGTVIVAWDKAPKAPAYGVEFRTIQYVSENDPPSIRWTKLRDVKRLPGNEVVHLEISRLPVDSSWFVRAFASDASGKIIEYSDVVRIASPPNPSRLWVIWWLAGAAGLIIFGFRLFARFRKNSAEAEAARIQRLEGGN
jgi:hypothetical protein